MFATAEEAGIFAAGMVLRSGAARWHSQASVEAEFRAWVARRSYSARKVFSASQWVTCEPCLEAVAGLGPV